MFDAKKLLDAVIGAAAKAGQPAATGQGQGRPPAVGQPADQLLKVAKYVLAQHPGLAQAAAVGLAGLLFGKRKPGRGVTGSLAKLGGLAVIGGLAYKAWQNAQAGKPLLDLAGAPAARQGGAPPAARPASADAAAKPRETFHALEVPQGSGFDPVAQTDDDALLYLRAMVAAATADGQVDAAERERITRGLDRGRSRPAGDKLARDPACGAGRRRGTRGGGGDPGKSGASLRGGPNRDRSRHDSGTRVPAASGRGPQPRSRSQGADRHRRRRHAGLIPARPFRRRAGRRGARIRCPCGRSGRQGAP